MTGYRIDQQVLSDTALGIDQGAQALRDGIQALRDVNGSELGTDRLTAAAANLLDRLGGELGAVLTGLTGTAAGVRRCLAEYTNAERRIIDLLHGNKP